MNSEEFEKLCDELRAQYSVIVKKENPDATEEEVEKMCDGAIMNELWDMFVDEKIEKEDLVKMAGQLGFEPTDEFMAKNGDVIVKSDETQTIPTEEGGDLKVGKEEIEEAQGYDDNDYKEEDKEEDKKEEEKEDDEEDDDERKKARKLFGFDDDEEE